ncbi:D-hexose-6-phosphate mutarotase [Arhodomonas sp. AD133]|uniref:D-hexose-6-phosphate mutarotase n=1 Tax=Arhodomonas sp. AD133 TaxID=3415009 RepID=UPI003EBA1B7D
MNIREHYRGDDVPAIRLDHADGSGVEIALQGGQVLRWWLASGEEMLYLSPLARFGDNAAIRGGVPVIFPQFAERGPLPKHGFARNRRWRLEGQGSDHAEAAVTLVLEDDEVTRAVWEHAFALRLRVALAPGKLTMQLTVSNEGGTRFGFTGALHTYLRVPDMGHAAILGLAGRRFEEGGAARRQTEEALTWHAGAVDRIYPDAPWPLYLATRGEPRLAVHASGFPDAVVWNPGAAGAGATPDLPDNAHCGFVCVEAGCVAQPVILAPGAQWTGEQCLQA